MWWIVLLMAVMAAVAIYDDYKQKQRAEFGRDSLIQFINTLRHK